MAHDPALDPALNLDLTLPENLKNPFPVYEWLREEDPVHWSERFQGWVVTRYEDVLYLYQNPIRFSADRFRKIDEQYASKRPDVIAVAKVLRDWAVFRDPPDHTRVRGLLNNTFTPRELERMRPIIKEIVGSLFDRVEARGQMDFIEDFAFPLPATVIAVMLGAPLDSVDDIKRWSDDLGAYLGGAQDEFDNFEKAKDGLFSLCDFFRELIAQHKRKPQDDLISLMLAAESDGAMFGEDEIVSNCVLLLFAGHETTTNLLGNGLFHLLKNPDQHRLLVERPELVASAVEEFLRFDGPVPATAKIATEETELRGQRIQVGEKVFPFNSAANRDRRRFDNPESLDITRKSNRHLSFGYGIHFCLGAPLARLEAQIAFSAMLQRFDDWTLLDQDPAWVPQIFLRGLKSLPISFRPTERAKAVGE